MNDFKNLTLSDFYNMDIGVREDGTLTVIVDRNEKGNIGLVGFNASEDDSDVEIKEAAFLHYQKILYKLSKYGE